MATHKFVIHAPVDPREGSVTLDGKRLEGVTRASFELSAQGETLLRLEIMGEVIVEGEFRESAILSVRQENPDTGARR